MELLAALKELYCNKSYNERLFRILEDHFSKTNTKRGRPGMDLWTIFVLAQVRLCKNTSYEALHDYSNNHKTLRQLIGVEYDFGYDAPEFSYNTIYDNVSMLSDETIEKINTLIVEFGHHEVFKKKETTALQLKSDSFVVESNVHFPTDYNLLWDCLRKILDLIPEISKRATDLTGFRKLKQWYRELKNLTRAMGKASGGGGKNKLENEKKAAQALIDKALLFIAKVDSRQSKYTLETELDMHLLLSLEFFRKYALKHIDLLNRRVIKGEKIPHSEKIFSVFEIYTEWVNKGKSRPNIELGKKLCITTDQYNLIVHHRIMEDEQDSEIVLDLAQTITDSFQVDKWSFDKGFWNKDNKEILELVVNQVIMPKKGKPNKKEKEEESSKTFKKYRNKHSAIESNINELEHRGADRCPDRGWDHFKRYVSLSICAYNLKKIGRQLLTQQREQSTKLTQLESSKTAA